MVLFMNMVFLFMTDDCAQLGSLRGDTAVGESAFFIVVVVAVHDRRRNERRLAHEAQRCTLRLVRVELRCLAIIRNCNDGILDGSCDGIC